jgi:rRNA pseudouridine-1189 N-methylase Emg1 (Nep1/Mra1 family)
MSTLNQLFVEIDARSVLLLNNKIPKSPAVDFCHQILLTLNQTSFWQCGRIHCYLDTPDFIIEISPLLRVPISPKEFRALLAEAYQGQEIFADRVKLLIVRRHLPPLPKAKFSILPMSQKVVDPGMIVSESILVHVSPGSEIAKYEAVCFSRYPLYPLNQCVNLVSAFELANGIQ